jgi:hypothetical protein
MAEVEKAQIPLKEMVGKIPGFYCDFEYTPSLLSYIFLYLSFPFTHFCIYCGTEGFQAVLILLWTDFWADFYSYVFTVSCAGLAFGSLFFPPNGAPA